MKKRASMVRRPPKARIAPRRNPVRAKSTVPALLTSTAVTVRVNGVPRTATVDVRTTLVDFLREHLGLTGTHVGCEHGVRSEEHTSELQSRGHLVCRLLLEKKKYSDTN